MLMNQLSIFVENKKGRLAEITQVLANNGIDIRALSIADTADYGIFRLIVNDPEKAAQALKEEGMTVSVTNVLAIGIEDTPGSFSKAVQILSDKDINVDYAYAFITPKENAAYVIIRVDDIDAAGQVLQQAGIRLLTQQDIFN